MIAGSVVGALLVVTGAVVGLIFFRRRSSRSSPGTGAWETKIDVGDETEQVPNREVSSLAHLHRELVSTHLSQPPPSRSKMPVRDPVAPLPAIPYGQARQISEASVNEEDPMMSNIVERVYQRLQAERPTYDEATDAPLPSYAPNQTTRMRGDVQ